MTDRLAQLGAQMLIVPTMDVVDWGQRQHELHARVVTLRAAEYHIPIFRVASSGISQAVDCTGRLVATAPCSGDGAMLAANLTIGSSGRRPMDRWLAPLSTGITALVFIALLVQSGARKRKLKLASS